MEHKKHNRIDGRALASQRAAFLRERIAERKRPPSLGIVYVGNDPVIDTFVRYKQRFGEKIGAQVQVHRFPVSVERQELIASIESLSKEHDGIIVQLPLPASLPPQEMLDAVPVDRDVDVLTQRGLEAFRAGTIDFFPPVAGAIHTVFRTMHETLRGKNIVVLGYGKLVGKPFVAYLEREHIPYTLIRAHHSEEERKHALRHADIVVSGVGIPHLIRSEDVREGVVLIDAGTSEAGKKIVGDVHPDAYHKARYYTPVPGGIGPLTIAVLFENLLRTKRKTLNELY